VWAIPETNQDGTLVTVNSAKLTIMAHQKYINCVRISPNDKMIATSSQDKQIKLWDAQTLSLKATLTGHKKGVWDL
jgi:U3 small nucleolar RNA-associated protein 13